MKDAVWASTEKRRHVPPARPETAGEQKESADSSAEKAPQEHGRRAAEALRGPRKIEVAHFTLKPGDVCPQCQKGKVHLQKEPQLLARLVGQAPLEATAYRLQKLGCKL